MEQFMEFIDRIEEEENRLRSREVILWVLQTFQELGTRVAWNQPTFTHHGTFILSIAFSKKHLTITPEQFTVEKFSDEIIESGYKIGKMTFGIPWDRPVNYKLLEQIIRFNIKDKKDSINYWRKAKK